MRNIQVSPTIANCAFLFNEVFETGGAMYNYEASPLIINTIFRENSVSFGAGGAISNRSNSSTVLVNCLLAGNTSDQLAGAIYNENAQITLLNCTISGNTQQSQGTIDTHGGSVTIRNTIIYGNNGGITSEDADVAVTYSLVEGRTASDTDHNLDGTTNPQFTGDENWTLLPCSPAVNRGASEALPDIPAIATDLAANPRIYNVQTDMGAYEMQAVPGPGTLPSGGESATLPVYAGATSITDNCKTFALIEPTGAPGALGNVTVKTFLAAGNTVSEGQKVFVKRHYDITPTGTDGPAKVTLYFSKQDFEDYNQAYGNANNASLPANLKVVQYHGTSPYGFPGTYSGPTQLITNVTVTESADHNSYEVSFQVSGFSGFFISGQSEAALPVTLVSFRAEKREHQAYLQWQTSSEINSRGFEIERSGDGRRWHHLGDVMAKGGESVVTDYSYTDPSPVTGTNMYRLKMTDADGSFAYSRIAVLDFRDETAALYPNPAVGTSEVHLKGIPENEISKVALFNASGQMLANPVWRRGTMDVSRLTAGTYMVEIARTNGDKMRFRFVVVK
ncbi:T9SS type A sorting domain-containing protein [Dyadobacter sp. 676]|uniref:T9SS type A sorting domain-containing protein n=1 Tax=Dyadobacter sp. 676 TaxID=3088362 RepID=A0AAU8FJG7_9BACT